MNVGNIGIDLGTVNTIVYAQGKGIVLNEPSVVAYDVKTDEIIAIGDEANDMLGKTPASIVAMYPLKDGVISDHVMSEHMMRYFVEKSCSKNIVKPKIAICIPTETTEVEGNAVISAAVSVGARQVHLIKEPIAAAIGAGLDITQPNGRMIIDIGGGTCDVAVISLGGIVMSSSIKVGGQRLNEAIVKYFRERKRILLGEKTAEKAKIEHADLMVTGIGKEFELKGRNLMTGLPVKFTANQTDIKMALMPLVNQILAQVCKVLEKTPPELAGDIKENGIIMTGGSSMLGGLAEYLEKNIKSSVKVAENAIECVAIGTGRSFEFIESGMENIEAPKSFKKTYE